MIIPNRQQYAGFFLTEIITVKASTKILCTNLVYHRIGSSNFVVHAPNGGLTDQILLALIIPAAAEPFVFTVGFLD